MGFWLAVDRLSSRFVESAFLHARRLANKVVFSLRYDSAVAFRAKVRFLESLVFLVWRQLRRLAVLLYWRPSIE